MVVAHKDARIRYRPAERKAVVESGLRMLCLANGNMRAQDQVACFQSNLRAIERMWGVPGPWIVTVRRKGGSARESGVSLGR
ncbi:MAG: hypothetical protein LBK59_04225 [Bifidobacteriaceae bacterium]|jgi:hypothetical protein|nr:hypothetical protein [Bifidobacteriaceae bacterium]